MTSTSSAYSCQRAFPTLCMIFGLCIPIASCDPLAPMLLCNGYGETVRVATAGNEGNRRGTAVISSGKCGELEYIQVSKEEISKESQTPAGFRGMILVYSVSQKMKGKYLVPSHRILDGMGTGSNPHYLVNSEGLFLIPNDLTPDWANKITSVQEKSVFSLPNSLRDASTGS